MNDYPYLKELVEQALQTNNIKEIQDILKTLGFQTLGMNDDDYTDAAYEAIDIVEAHRDNQ